jgi:hypothetical protein
VVIRVAPVKGGLQIKSPETALELIVLMDGEGPFVSGGDWPF